MKNIQTKKYYHNPNIVRKPVLVYSPAVIRVAFKCHSAQILISVHIDSSRFGNKTPFLIKFTSTGIPIKNSQNSTGINRDVWGIRFDTSSTVITIANPDNVQYVKTYNVRITLFLTSTGYDIINFPVNLLNFEVYYKIYQYW